MKVLFAVDEAYPLFKVGGLGDVGGSLPIALKKLGVDVRLCVPFHPEVDGSAFEKIDAFEIDYDHERLSIEVFKGLLPNSSVETYLIKNTKYISQHTDASDNHADKFAVFSLAIAQWLAFRTQNWKPEIVHIHDWHVSLLPLIVKDYYHNHDYRFMLTIHNLMYQGRTETPVLEKIGFDPGLAHAKREYAPEYKLNILLEGILASEVVTTVSRQYVDEILTPEYGENIEIHLQHQKHKLYGILNGLDLETFNPAKDRFISQKYDVTSYYDGKRANKMALLKELNLDPNVAKPLIGFVGRVDARQKGVQLIIELINQGYFESKNVPLVFLGTGDPHLETQLHQAAEPYQNMRIFTRYDEPLAARIYAAADIALIPSKFEPCGLVQMIAMRYGTLPVARATGGLKDTIIEGVDGFLFQEYDSKEFAAAIDRSLDILHQPQRLAQMIRQAMIKDFSWDASAVEYVKLYSNTTHVQ